MVPDGHEGSQPCRRMAGETLVVASSARPDLPLGTELSTDTTWAAHLTPVGFRTLFCRMQMVITAPTRHPVMERIKGHNSQTLFRIKAMCQILLHIPGLRKGQHQQCSPGESTHREPGTS